MSDEVNDDPRQVLAILNSLGVVGVTATELKDFMKELKLYRKLKRKEREEWKEEVKTKLLNRQECIDNTQINMQNSCNNTQKNKTYMPKKEPRRTKSERVKRDCTEIIIDNCKPKVDEEKENVEKRVPSIEVTIRCSKKAAEKNEQVEKKVKEQKSEVKSKCSTNRSSNKDKVSTERQSRKRSKSVTPCSSRRTGSTKSRSRSKSFIRSQNVFSRCKTQLSNRRLENDPVALYNKYKSIWEQLQLPGQGTHARLRWAVREKMLGSNPNPKPVVEYKRPLRTSSAASNKKKMTAALSL